MYSIHLDRISYGSLYNNVALFFGMLICKSHSKKHFVSPLVIIHKFLMTSVNITKFCNNSAGFSMSSFFSDKTEYFYLRMTGANSLHLVTKLVIFANYFLLIKWIKMLFCLFKHFIQSVQIRQILFSQISVKVFSF